MSGAQSRTDSFAIHFARWFTRISLFFLTLGLILAIWAFWWEPRRLVVRQERLQLPGWTQPLRVAVLTDLHIGSPYNDLPKLDRIIDVTNALRPDLIVLLGDFVIQGVVGGDFVAPERIAEYLKRLRAPLGTFSVLGNHDGWLDAQRVRASLESAGIVVLEDSAQVIATAGGRFWLGGVSDLWVGRHDIAKTLSYVTDAAPTLLMTHNPDVFPDVPYTVDLTLAGHTHGGQIRLPFFGPPLVPSSYGQRYAAGHVIEGGRHLFVATGTGTSILPVRFRVPPAVFLLELQPGL